MGVSHSPEKGSPLSPAELSSTQRPFSAPYQYEDSNSGDGKDSNQNVTQISAAQRKIFHNSDRLNQRLMQQKVMTKIVSKLPFQLRESVSAVLTMAFSASENIQKDLDVSHQEVMALRHEVAKRTSEVSTLRKTCAIYQEQLRGLQENVETLTDNIEARQKFTIKHRSAMTRLAATNRMLIDALDALQEGMPNPHNNHNNSSYANSHVMNSTNPNSPGGQSNGDEGNNNNGPSFHGMLSRGQSVSHFLQHQPLSANNKKLLQYTSTSSNNNYNNNYNNNTIDSNNANNTNANTNTNSASYLASTSVLSAASEAQVPPKKFGQLAPLSVQIPNDPLNNNGEAHRPYSGLKTGRHATAKEYHEKQQQVRKQHRRHPTTSCLKCYYHPIPSMWF